MGKKKMKRLITWVLAICMMLSCMVTGDYGAIQAHAEETKSNIYFLNTGKWNNVGAYIYGDKGYLLGEFINDTPVVSATELGGDWMKVEVSEEPPYSIIFYNKEKDIERSELYLPGAENIYVTANAQSYASQAAAESAMGIGGGSTSKTKVYFYNSDKYENVTAHAWIDNGEGVTSLTGGWGDTRASVSEIGSDWMEVEINAEPSFHLILADSDDTTEKRRITVDITDENNIYVSLKGKYATKEAAENSVSENEGTVTRVWFYNIYGYESIRVHGWNDNGDLFSPQPMAVRESINSNWYYIDVPVEAPFNIQFIDNVSGEVQQGYVQGNSVYLAVTDKLFSSKKSAEDYMSNMHTTIYFYNHIGNDENSVPYEEIRGYAYADGKPINEAWPGVKAKESSIGENWWEIDIPVNALLQPFTLIINNNQGKELDGLDINNYKDNYITLKGDKVYKTQDSAEISAGVKVETILYLLNDRNWVNTGVYIYGRPGEALGGWPGGTPEAAPELGEKWQKIKIPARTPFSLIYYNADKDSERAEMLLSSKHNLYIAGSGGAYGSQFEAEAACGMIDPSELAVIYFYNSRNWGDINAYTYRFAEEEKITVGKSWPGTASVKATEIGENWWKATIPMKKDAISKDNAIGIIFNDGVNQMLDPGCKIDDPSMIYVIPNNTSYATAKEAEEAAALDNYDDECEEGPNKDYANYKVSYNGAGAALPYITYEAEDANTNGEILEKNTSYREAIQSEASGRQAVLLDETGEFVEFTLTSPANGLVLRYSIPDTANGSGEDATLSCYINGTEKENLKVTSRYSWLYGPFPFNNNPSDGGAHRYYDEMRVLFDEVMPAGTTIKLQKDADDTAANYVIDFIEMENVGAPLTQPKNSLSVTDFGAVANDGKEDREAFEECIKEAKKQKKEVWIPAGDFDLIEKKFFTVSGVTIRGAGMWHTNLNGEGAAFKYYGTAKFHDFAMTGVTTIRDDSNDFAGIEGNGSRSTNVTVENIWMEHMKVGVWSCNSENLIIQGCRIRNTFADGINLCSATNNAVVRNNQLRNTGDDSIASWPWLANCTGNTIVHNTIQVPTLANGVAIYGGGEFVVDNNYVADTICNGAGVVVGSEFETPKSFTGTVTVKNNVLDRCGSMQADEGYPIGAIWIWSSTRFSDMNATFNVFDNVMNDCVRTGITIECGNNLTGVNIQRNTINGATDAVHEYYPGGPGTGSGKLGNLKTSNLTGVVHKDDAPNFILEFVDEEENKNNGNENNGGNSSGNSNNGGNSGNEETSNTGSEGNSNDKKEVNGVIGNLIVNNKDSNGMTSISNRTNTTRNIINTNLNKEKEVKVEATGSESNTKTKMLTPSFTEMIKAIFGLEGTEDDVEISFKINNSAAPSKEKEEAVEQMLGNKKVAAYYDIELMLSINSNDEQKVKELKDKIRLTLDIPEEYLNDNYVYAFIRVHEGEDGLEVEILNDMDSDPSTITIETDRFSTYVLSYEESANNSDMAEAVTDQTEDPVEESPAELIDSETDSSVSIWLWVIVIAVIAAVAVSGTIVYYVKKKENNTM